LRIRRYDSSTDSGRSGGIPGTYVLFHLQIWAGAAAIELDRVQLAAVPALFRSYPSFGYRCSHYNRHQHPPVTVYLPWCRRRNNRQGNRVGPGGVKEEEPGGYTRQGRRGGGPARRRRALVARVGMGVGKLARTPRVTRSPPCERRTGKREASRTVSTRFRGLDLRIAN
jgi:hypothetical protein